MNERQFALRWSRDETVPGAVSSESVEHCRGRGRPFPAGDPYLRRAVTPWPPQPTNVGRDPLRLIEPALGEPGTGRVSFHGPCAIRRLFLGLASQPLLRIDQGSGASLQAAAGSRAMLALDFTVPVEATHEPVRYDNRWNFPNQV